MVEKKGGQIIKQDLLSMKNNDGEIPVLLAAAKGHKEMTKIFCVALNLLKQIPDMPLAHKSKSDGVQPLYALARMCSMFPSGSRYGFIQRFLYKILREKKVQNPGTAVIDIVTNVAPQEKQPKTSFTG
ncbi:hypothetical protein P8452_46687 [Trifolium repens]|nr:hypothetical protein P8452_46687 [Trifolium repens]